ncbi:MAG: hypothetical protein OJF49_001074 [Ktedonobacterales bacterium]|jgi:hypothetical protein|nr:MAG: hypothetical protein OJF49_001074 [Ktedonobacterales bacterium]
MIQWGSVAEWVSGLGSLGAVITALVFSMRALNDAREARLGAVFAWVEATSSPSAWSLVMSNVTDYPIYQWEVFLRWDLDSVQMEDTINSTIAGIIPPGKHAFAWTPAASLPGSEAHVSVELRFSDLTGRKRVKKFTGKVTR